MTCVLLILVPPFFTAAHLQQIERASKLGDHLTLSLQLQPHNSNTKNIIAFYRAVTHVNSVVVHEENLDHSVIFSITRPNVWAAARGVKTEDLEAACSFGIKLKEI